jgi:hypothetical protein
MISVNIDSPDEDLARLHSANGDQSPIEFENSFRKVSGCTEPEQLPKSGEREFDDLCVVVV